MTRVVKVIVAGWAIGFGIALTGFLLLLWISGPPSAERVWGPIPLSVLFLLGVVVSARYLK